MINTNMREYNYFTYEDTGSYGQPKLSAEPKGTIKLAISVITQAIQDNVLFNNAQFTGITHDVIDDTYVIQYGKDKLKVLYVIDGRFKQVFMSRM